MRPARSRPRTAAVLTLLTGTFLGTVTNNVVNVPLAQITRGYHASLASGVLVVSAFVLVLAMVMPLTGWISDRLGRRRILSASLLFLSAGLLGSALSPDLPVLVGTRALQGLACAAIAPAVMGALPGLFSTEERARAMSFWAAANGLGQAAGPPLGGLISGALGWRAIFLFLAPIALVASLGTARFVPEDGPRPVALHWPGASALTLGSALLMLAVTAAAQHWADWRLTSLAALLGCSAMIVFARVSRDAPSPLISPSLLIETRFLRSATAAFVQMAALAATLVAVPLYATRMLGLSAPLVGLLVFALPAAMVVAAVPVGRLADRRGPRQVMRAGLTAIVASQLGLAVLLGSAGAPRASLVVALLAVGVGVAAVQTPSAAGATRSPAGRSGAALGVFNMIRFAGSAVGAAWVAVLLSAQDYRVIFFGSAALVSAGLGLTFLGRDPEVSEITEVGSQSSDVTPGIRPA